MIGAQAIGTFQALQSILLPELGKSCGLIVSEWNQVLRDIAENNKASMNAIADESVDQKLWIGDSCGYLAAQAQARLAMGLQPTDEQMASFISKQGENE